MTSTERIGIAELSGRLQAASNAVLDSTTAPNDAKAAEILADAYNEVSQALVKLENYRRIVNVRASTGRDEADDEDV